MSELKLGNDFTSEEESAATEVEKEAKKPDLESGETEDSADTSKGENLEEADESAEEEIPKEKEEEKAPEVPEEEPPEDKSKVLQGLLDTEKDLDVNGKTLDEQIAAARTRISDKRRERREKREVVETVDSKFPEPEETEDLSDVDPETLKVLDRFTRARGLVPKTELQKITYEERHKAAQDSFYETHPEYSSDNDVNDVLYNALKKELSLYAAPTDPKLIPKLFERAHAVVKGQYPDKFKAAVDKSVSREQVNKSVRLKTAGVGGKSAGGEGAKSSGSEVRTWSATQIDAMRRGGWSEEEIKKLLG